MTPEQKQAAKRMEGAYITGNLPYFHSKQFIKDMATMDWSLYDCLFDQLTVEDEEGTSSIISIWPQEPNALRNFRIWPEANK